MFLEIWLGVIQHALAPVTYKGSTGKSTTLAEGFSGRGGLESSGCLEERRYRGWEFGLQGVQQVLNQLVDASVGRQSTMLGKRRCQQQWNLVEMHVEPDFFVKHVAYWTTQFDPIKLTAVYSCTHRKLVSTSLAGKSQHLTCSTSSLFTQEYPFNTLLRCDFRHHLELGIPQRVFFRRACFPSIGDYLSYVGHVVFNLCHYELEVISFLKSGQKSRDISSGEYTRCINKQ